VAVGGTGGEQGGERRRRGRGTQGLGKTYPGGGSAQIAALHTVLDKESFRCRCRSQRRHPGRHRHRIRAQAAAGQVAATLRTLITANLIRQAAGLTTEETAAQSYAEAEAAFALLESGLSAFSS
jgi:hypothetical protein